MNERRIDVEAVRRGVSLLALLPPDAKPRRTGKDEYRALCSFHEEKRAAMSIKLLRSGWYFNCFACGEKGDAFAYYMRTRKVGFREALAALVGSRPDLVVTTPTRRAGFVLVCDGRGCSARREHDQDELVAACAGEWGWYVSGDRQRALCPGCVLTRMLDPHWNASIARRAAC